MFSSAETCDFELNPVAELEPRLIEYIKKKKYYRENEINDDLVEKDFNIDKKDIAKIKKYFQGKKTRKTPGHADMVEQDKNDFPSNALKKDPRFERVKIKQKRDQEANEQRGNYDIVAREYDMYRDDRKFASAYGNDFKSRFNPQVWFENSRNSQEWESDEEMDNPHELNKKASLCAPPKKHIQSQQQPQVSKNDTVDMRRRYSNPNVYKHTTPKIRYEDRVTWGCNDDLASENYSLDSIMGKLDKHNHNVTRHHRKDEMDLDININAPKKKRFNIDQDANNVVPQNSHSSTNPNISRNKRSNEMNYYTDTQTNNKKMKDVDIENYLCYGNGPSRGAKSLGYPNPAEHYFQYISDDVSKPEHSVFEPGMPSRMYNKDTARPYNKRDVLQ